jgi:hypothetical protein
MTTGRAVLKKTIKMQKETNNENSMMLDSTIADWSLLR